MTGIKIVSDFKDYYDIVSDENSSIVYNRFWSKCEQRATALRNLQSMGTRTIEIKPVSNFLFSDGRLVVYTNPKLHNGQGKKIMTVGEARQIYLNYTASQYFENSDGFVKFLQVGKRRFIISYKRTDNDDLSKSIITDINEISSEYNRIVALPIFSIDYISLNNVMVATDFNEVESLQNCGVDKLLAPEVVAEEIKNSLIAYNKA